jgi:hypothetical protein
MPSRAPGWAGRISNKHAFSSKQTFLDYVQVERFVDEDGNINTWRNEGKKLRRLS